MEYKILYTKTKTFSNEAKAKSYSAQYEQLFEKIVQIIREKKITELNIQNINETGFQIDFGKAKLVVIIEPNKPVCMINPRNRNYITSVKCISSADETIPLMLLIFRVNI